MITIDAQRVIAWLDVLSLNTSNAVSPSERLARLEPTSKYKISLLSPKSKKIRHKKLVRSKYRAQKYLKNLLQKNEILLEESQAKELNYAIDLISRQYPEELQEVFNEAGSICSDGFRCSLLEK
jgi:hypothetical protein